MTWKERYEQRKVEQKRFLDAPFSDVMVHQDRRYMKPFHIFGPVYFVGDSWVCVHLIDTGEGLLLIDAGNVGYTPYLVQAIWELGFRPNDVKWIVLSHGHMDHFGAACFFRDMFGTEIYLGEKDARMFREQPELSLVSLSPDLRDDVFVPDHEITDGEVMRFGKISMTSWQVPGHTDGCISLFFEAEEDGVSKRFGYYGGFGFNTLTLEERAEAGDPGCTMWKVYEQSLDRVIEEHVDIFLGNHTDNNHTAEKYEQLTKGCKSNPFIDDTEWKAFLMQKKEELHAFTASEEKRREKL